MLLIGVLSDGGCQRVSFRGLPSLDRLQLQINLNSKVNLLANIFALSHTDK